MNRTKQTRRGGFTLVELMVVTVIIAVLAALVVFISKRALRSARAAAEVSNLNQCMKLVSMYGADVGYFPAGYNWTTGRSWATEVLTYELGDEPGTIQADVFLSPLLNVKVDPDASWTVTHFGGNPYVFADSGPVDRKTGLATPKWKISPTRLLRPSETFLLCSMPPASQDADFKSAHALAWAMRNMAGGGFPADGSVPKSNPALAQRSLNLSPNLAKEQQYNDLPDFFRFSDGKGRFVFGDGHIEKLAPEDLKQKHLAVSY